MRSVLLHDMLGYRVTVHGGFGNLQFFKVGFGGHRKSPIFIRKNMCKGYVSKYELFQYNIKKPRECPESIFCEESKRFYDN